jgi:hypothetical protein
MAQEPQAAPDYAEAAPPSAPMPEPPPPPEAQAQVSYAAPAAYAPPATYAQPAAAPAGQWVYTNQYGWVWMPYGADYTYVGGTNVAYTFAYYPHFGWRWLSAPWVVGYGPSPYWGRLGPARFAWYGHPGFRGYAPRGGWYGHAGVRVAAPHAVYSHAAYRAPAPHVAWRGGGGGFHGGFHGGGGGFHGGGHHR